MNEITGAALDAAVAAALAVPDLVTRPSGQPAYESTFDPEVPAHEYDLKAYKMYRWFNPSHDGDLAMKLLIEHGISLICEDTPNLDVKWLACWSPHSGEWGDTDGKYAAWGPTPQVAICRALVRRAKVQAYEARRDAHNAYWAEVLEVANRRAFDAAVARKPHTVFANDDEKVAYIWCMDRAAIRMKIISGEATSAAFEQLAPMPPPFTDTDGSVVYPLSDGREKFVADYDPAFYRDAVMGNPFL